MEDRYVKWVASWNKVFIIFSFCLFIIIIIIIIIIIDC